MKSMQVFFMLETVANPQIGIGVNLGHLMWAHQDLNLGPPDYESGALTN